MLVHLGRVAVPSTIRLLTLIVHLVLNYCRLSMLLSDISLVSCRWQTWNQLVELLLLCRVLSAQLQEVIVNEGSLVLRAVVEAIDVAASIGSFLTLKDLLLLV